MKDPVIYTQHIKFNGMERKLISMVDYVLWLMATESEEHNKIINYAKFLKEPLALWMFIPCGEDGKPLEEPIDYKSFNMDFPPLEPKIWKKCEQYQRAKAKCYFEDFEYRPNGFRYGWEHGELKKGDKNPSYIEVMPENEWGIWGESYGRELYTVENLVNLFSSPITLTESKHKELFK